MLLGVLDVARRLVLLETRGERIKYWLGGRSLVVGRITLETELPNRQWLEVSVL